MRILILGSDGFVGRSVKAALSPNHEIYSGVQNLAAPNDHAYSIDLLHPGTIRLALDRAQPEVIINCAGVVENSEKAALNPLFTSNLLAAAVASGLTFNNIIITGSAAEYGVVDPAQLPVKEDAPLAADSLYGQSKIEETRQALSFRDQHHLPVVVARIFNPIGPGMHPRFLISRLIGQIEEIRTGQRQALEVTRLDARRDYIDIRDLATAIAALVAHKTPHAVYNVGSGRGTSNGELVELLLSNSKLLKKPGIIETSDQPEPTVAAQADISRLLTDTGWRPRHSIEATIKEILHAQRQ